MYNKIIQYSSSRCRGGALRALSERSKWHGALLSPENGKNMKGGLNMFENVIMFEELQKIVMGCDVITYFDCAYAIAVVSDECFHDVYIYDSDKAVKQWSFVGQFNYSDWRQLHKFIDTLKSIRHPFNTDGSLKDGYVPF